MPIMLVGLSLQTYFSIQHPQAAAYLARRAARLERRAERSTSTLIPTRCFHDLALPRCMSMFGESLPWSREILRVETGD
jgi:hypothetical protein